MTIQHFLIHQFGRSAADGEVKLRFQEKTREPGALESAWLDSLLKSYGDKADKRFGFLADADKGDSFAGRLKSAVSANGDLPGLSRQLLKDLSSEFGQSKLSFSAYALFSHYKIGLTEYLVVAMLSDTAGFAIDEALGLEEVRHLDLSRLHCALRINLSEWSLNAKASKYVSLVQARGASHLAEPLMEKIGFEESARSVEETAQLVRAFEAYCDAQAEPDQAIELKQRAYDYCTEQLKAGTPVALGDLSAYLDSERPEAFVSFARDSDYKLPEEMPLEKRGLRKLVKFSATTAELSITFSAALMGNSINYDAKSDTLTITNLPPTLRSQLIKG